MSLKKHCPRCNKICNASDKKCPRCGYGGVGIFEETSKLIDKSLLHD